MMINRNQVGVEWLTLIRSIILALCIFVVDLSTPQEYDVWLLHIILLMLISLKNNSRNTTIVALICTIFTLLDLFVSPTGIPAEHTLTNRTIGIAILGFIAVWSFRTHTWGTNHAHRFKETIAGTGTAVPLRIAGTYVLIAGVWITFSDRALDALVYSRDLLIEISEIKGWVFVLLTGSLLYAMLQHYVSSRKRIEDELRESEELYHKLVSASPDAIAEIDADGLVTFASPQALELFGNLSLTEVVTHSFLDWVAPEDRSKALANMQRLSAKGTLEDTEYLLLKKDGTRFYGEVNAAVLHAAEGRRKGMIVTIRDITERKKAGKQIRMLSRAVEQSPSSVIVTDLNGNIEYVNPKFTRLTGYTFEDVLGKNPRILKSGATLDEEYKHLWQTISSGNEWRGEFLNKKKNGESYWEYASISPIVDDEGRITHYLAVKEDINDRKRAEEELHRSNERFQLIARATNDAVWDWDIRTNSLWWNETLHKMYGYPEKSLQNREGWESRIHPDDRNRVQASFRTALERKDDTWSDEYRFLHADGTYGYVLDRGFLLCDYNGTPIRMLGSMVDVTSLKLAELDQQFLAEERDKALTHLRLQFERMPIGYLLTDRNFKVTEWNPASEEIFGYTKEEAVGQHVFELIAPPSVKTFLNNFLREFKQSDQTMNAINENVTKDGTTILCEWFDTPLKNERGEFVGMMAMVQDITERKRAEQELQESEARLKQSQRVGATGHYTFDPATGRWTSSEMLDELFGIDAAYQKDVQGWINIVHPEHRTEMFAYLRDHVLKNGNTFDKAYRIVRASDGAERWMHGLGNLEFDNTGKPVRMFGIIQDITEHRKAEEELKKSNAQLRQLSAYLQSVREEERKRISREIHDELGQELTALKMEASLMQKAATRLEKMETKATLQDHASSLISITDRAIQTVRRIATELRPDVLDKLGLVDALQWQAEEFEKRTGIVCTVENKTSVREFNDDIATALFRIFQEALTNVARHSEASKVSALLSDGANEIQLHVEDNGRGIEEEQISNSPSLGLVGIRERARLLGGTATIKGKKGKGTTITVLLPLDASPIHQRSS